MTRTLASIFITILIFLCFATGVFAQQGQPGSTTYTWGKPQTVNTPVAVAVDPAQPAPNFPTIRPSSNAGRSIHALQRPTMRPIRKVTWPAPICLPPAPMPIYPVSQSSPMYAAVDAKILWQKAGISFHQNELGLSGTTPLGEFGIRLVDPNIGKIRYSVTTQQAVEETPAVTSGLMIGASQLVAVQAAAGQAAPVAGAAAAGTPVKINYQVGPAHRIDVVCIQSKLGPQNFWLSPAIVANWIPFQIKGSTTTGTITSATETFNNFYWGGGIEMVYQQPNSRISALVAGSDKYLLADCSLAYSVGSNLDFVFGWQGRQLKMDRDTIARLSSPNLGVLVRF